MLEQVQTFVQLFKYYPHSGFLKAKYLQSEGRSTVLSDVSWSSTTGQNQCKNVCMDGFLDQTRNILNTISKTNAYNCTNAFSPVVNKMSRLYTLIITSMYIASSIVSPVVDDQPTFTFIRGELVVSAVQVNTCKTDKRRYLTLCII